MTDDKWRNQARLKLRRDAALRELALAFSYPQTHTRIVRHRKRIDGALQVTAARRWPDSSVSPDDIDTHNVEELSLADRRRASVLRAITGVMPRKTPPE